MTNQQGHPPLSGFTLTPEEFRALWVEELRSGNWKQGRNRLGTEDGKFCCLGVACELYIRNGGELKKKILDDKSIEYSSPESDCSSYFFISTTSYLPDVVRLALGLKYAAGLLISKYRNHDSLEQCNDSGCKFTTIANIIERGGVRLSDNGE